MANVEKSAAPFESGTKSATTVRGEEVSNRIIFDGRNVEPLKLGKCILSIHAMIPFSLSEAVYLRR